MNGEDGARGWGAARSGGGGRNGCCCCSKPQVRRGREREVNAEGRYLLKGTFLYGELKWDQEGNKYRLCWLTLIQQGPLDKTEHGGSSSAPES